MEIDWDFPSFTVFFTTELSRVLLDSDKSIQWKIEWDEIWTSHSNSSFLWWPPTSLHSVYLFFFVTKKTENEAKRQSPPPHWDGGAGGGERINIHDRKSRDKKRHRLAGYFLSVKVRTHLARLQLGKKWHCCCCCCCCCCCSNCSSCTILATWGHQLATVPDPPQRTVISFFLSLVPLILSTGYRPSPSWMAVHRSKCHPRQRKTGKKKQPRGFFLFSLSFFALCDDFYRIRAHLSVWLSHQWLRFRFRFRSSLSRKRFSDSSLPPGDTVPHSITFRMQCVSFKKQCNSR